MRSILELWRKCGGVSLRFVMFEIFLSDRKTEVIDNMEEVTEKLSEVIDNSLKMIETPLQVIDKIE